MTWRIIEGDCREVMAGMEPDSVDAIVTDPPYGLEFMGKEWDRLDGGLPQENVWKGRRGAGGSHIGEDDTKPASRHHVGLGATRSRFRRCTTCGHRQFSGSPCRCDSPTWIYETPEGPPSGMVRMQRWHTEWATEALRVLKPGGHLLAFGGTRTYHRLACALEDAGFEIRDCLAWLYGSGFPKSLDIGKAIDKASGVDVTADERWVATPHPITGPMKTSSGNSQQIGQATPGLRHLYEPATDAAREWDGWGTALKPAWESIVLARKPLGERTVAANVLRYGTGGLNVDGCRLDGVERTLIVSRPDPEMDESSNAYGNGVHGSRSAGTTDSGRWPPNVALDPEAAAMLDAQTGVLHSQDPATRNSGLKPGWSPAGTDRPMVPKANPNGADRGGASRFFYCPKADRAERNVGLDGGMLWGGEEVASTFAPTMGNGIGGREHDPADPRAHARNNHPTVKPIALMRWLCRLITPPGGTVLDPFAGSGSTGIAALAEGFAFVGIEREADYARIARLRIAGAGSPLLAPEVEA